MGTAAEATFVGRRDELVQVREALAAARGSVPQIVAIAAPAGMGKTAFLRRCLAEERDAIVLEVSGDESEVDFEYGVAAQLVAQAQAAVPDEMLEIRPVSALAMGADLLAILGALQDRAEVIVAVDDAHLMDRSTAARTVVRAAPAAGRPRDRPAGLALGRARALRAWLGTPAR